MAIYPALRAEKSVVLLQYTAAQQTSLVDLGTIWVMLIFENKVIEAAVFIPTE